VDEKEDFEMDIDIADADTGSNLEVLTKMRLRSRLRAYRKCLQSMQNMNPDPVAAVVAGHHNVIQQPKPAQSVSHVIVDDQALWKVGDHATVEYWIRAGPSTCRHRDGVYEKSVRKPEKGSAPTS